MALVSGDISNRLEQLRSELRRWRFAGEFSLPQLSTGDPSAFLPLLHFVLLHASAPLSKWLSDRGYELAGKCDLRFVEVVYRLCRAEFNYNPVLTSKQFLTAAFAERKLQMVADLSARCRAKHKDLVRALTMGRKVGPSMAAYQAGGADMLSTPKRTKTVALTTVASPSIPTTEQPRSTVPRPTSSSGGRTSSRPAPVLPRVARSAQGSLPRATVVCELPSNSQPSGTNVPVPPDHACAKSLTATCRMAAYDSLPGDQRGHMCSSDNFAATPDAFELEPQQLDLQDLVDARTSEEEVNCSYNRAVNYEQPQLDSAGYSRSINSFLTAPPTAAGCEPPELNQGVLEDSRTLEREVTLSYGEHESFFMTAVQGVSAEEVEEDADDSADDDDEIMAHHALVDTAFGHRHSLLVSALPPMVDPHLRTDIVVEPALADATDFHGGSLNGKFALGRAMCFERDQVLSSAPVALLSCSPSPVVLPAATESSDLERFTSNSLGPHHNARQDVPAHSCQSSESDLSTELLKLQKLVLHTNAQLESLKDHCDASFQNVNAKLSLIEGRMKLLEAAEPHAPVAEDVQRQTLVHKQQQLRGVSGIDAATPPRSKICRALDDNGMHFDREGPSSSRDIESAGGVAPQAVVTTCKSAYSQYLSTQAFIADICRKFNETQELLHKASAGASA